MADSCSTCRFFQGEPHGQRQARQCRALPPQFAVEHASPDGGRFYFVANWPYTGPADWCGGFRAIDPPPPDPAESEVEVIDTGAAGEAVTVVESGPPPEPEPEAQPPGEPEDQAPEQPKGRKKKA